MKSANRIVLLVLFVALAQPVFALKPKRSYDAVPDTMGLPYQKNIIKTEDGLKLNSWTFLPSNGDKRINVILAYPDAGNMSWWTSQCALLSQMGYTVIMFDYRGFGQSDSVALVREMLYYDDFAKDLSAVYSFAQKKYPGHKMGIWCASMGSIITTLFTQTVNPDFIVADGYVTDPKKIQAHINAQKKHCDLPFSANYYVAVSQRIPVPMLIFSGLQDQQTPDADVQAYKKNKRNVQVVTFDGGHLGGFSIMSKDFMGSEYLRTMDTFLSKLPPHKNIPATGWHAPMGKL